ncbi:Transposon Tf2-6 polyprotein, partial [Choanephora cucurbitarum]
NNESEVTASEAPVVHKEEKTTKHQYNNSTQLDSDKLTADNNVASNTHNQPITSINTAIKQSSRPTIELIPVVHDIFLDSQEANRWEQDALYLSSLNAAITSSLPLYNGTIPSLNDKPITVQILIDNGASENYISPRVAEVILGIRTSVRDREVETAGGNISAITEKMSFELGLQGHINSMSAFVFNTKFDIIIGRSWIKRHKPEAHWDNDSWTLHCCCSRTGYPSVTIIPSNDTSTNRSSHQLNYLISHLQLESILEEEGTDCYYLYLLDNENKSKTKVDDLEDTALWTRELAKDFPSVFQEKLPGLPPMRNDFSHVIETLEDVRPINRPPFGMSPAELDELKLQLNELLSLGLIRKSTSEWGAPILFVRKKNGELRMCIDYRALNKVTKRNTNPLPQIDECLDRLQGASYFTSPDLRSGYHQIRIQDSDVPKTAFNTRYGKYGFLVLPFGLSNAPPSYQTWMNQILGDYIDKFALVYLHDVCIYSRTKEDHIRHVRDIQKRFEKEGLVVNLKKCEFGKRELEFLGYRVSQKGILPSESKIKAVKQLKRPTNVQEVRQFLGLAQHYRRFCPGFSTVASPMTELTHGTGAKKRAIIWNDACEESIKKIKNMLTSPPLLKLPDMNLSYRIETDSSDYGIDAVLLQQDPSSQAWRSIAYEFKKLSKPEQAFPAQDRELIAIIHALRTWRCFIDGCIGGYTVYSDHKPLLYFQSQLKPTPRLIRWMSEYELFNPRVEYKPGKDNNAADALSRRPNLLDDNEPEQAPLEPEYLYSIWDTLSPDIRVDWPMLYINDNHHKLRSSTLHRKLEMEKDHFVVRGNQVHRKVKVDDDSTVEAKFVPFVERADLVTKYHEGFGHAGIKHSTVVENMSTVPTEQQSRKSPSRREMPKTIYGNKWLLVAVDYLINWPIARAVPVASQEAVADFIYEEIVMRFGCPTEIITDRGANFTSGLVKAYVKRLSVNHELTSAFHPRTNGKVERYNGVLKQMLRKYVNGAIHRWDDFVNAALWTSRIRVHSTTGFSPFYLTYGREPKLPGDIQQPCISLDVLNDARTKADINLRELQLLGQHRAAADFRLRAMGEREKQIWDAKIKKVKFEAGDMVMLTHEGKYGLEPRFKGPYIITKTFPDYGTFQLETVAGEPLSSLVHADRLKPALGEKPLNPWYHPTASRRDVRDHNKTLSNTPASDEREGTMSVYKDQPPISSHPAFDINNPPPDWVDPPISSIPNLSGRAVTSTPTVQLPLDPDVTVGSRDLNNSDVTIINEDPPFETHYEVQFDADMNTVTLESNTESMEVADVNQSLSENILPSVSNEPLGIDEDMRLPDADMSDNDFLSLNESEIALDERLSLPDPVDNMMIPSSPTLSTESRNDSDTQLVETISLPTNSPLPPRQVVEPSTPISVEPSTVPTGSFSFRADIPSFAPPPVLQTKATSTTAPLKFKVPLVSPKPASPASSSSRPDSAVDVRGRTSDSKGGDVGLVLAAGGDIDEELSRSKHKDKRKRFAPTIAQRNQSKRTNKNLLRSTINKLKLLPLGFSY